MKNQSINLHWGNDDNIYNACTLLKKYVVASPLSYGWKLSSDNNRWTIHSNTNTIDHT